MKVRAAYGAEAVRAGNGMTECFEALAGMHWALAVNSFLFYVIVFLVIHTLLPRGLCR